VDAESRNNLRAMHDRWFSCVQNHTVRYVRGWERIDPDE
jgi:hypothetical protein